MSFHAMVLRQSLIVVVLLATFAMRPASAQLTDATGKVISPLQFDNLAAITTSFVTAPQQGGSSGASATGGNNQWLKVEFHYGTNANLKTKFLDSADFKIWIEGIDPEVPNPNSPSGKGVAIALTGSISYVNIPAGKDVYGVVYVHPNTLARFSDDRGFENFDRKYNIHIEASIGGVLVDAIDKKKDNPNWYDAKYLKPVGGFIYRADQSPFIMADTDRYPGLKLLGPAQ